MPSVLVCFNGLNKNMVLLGALMVYVDPLFTLGTCLNHRSISLDHYVLEEWLRLSSPDFKSHIGNDFHEFNNGLLIRATIKSSSR